MSDEATPRPWRASKDNLVRVIGPNAEIVAGVHRQGRFVGEERGTAQANAALIVKAVNTYPDLMAENARLRAELAMEAIETAIKVAEEARAAWASGALQAAQSFRKSRRKSLNR